MGPKMSLIFVRYNREFVITVIVITEFDCIVIIIILTSLLTSNQNLIL